MTAARLVEHAIAEQDLDALVLVAGDVDLGVGSGETAETTREIFGDPDGPLAPLDGLDEGDATAMLAEALAVAWWQRLSDAVDTAGPLPRRSPTSAPARCRADPP